MTSKNRQDIKLFRRIVKPLNIDEAKLTALFNNPDFSVGGPENLKWTSKGLPDRRRLTEILKPVFTEARKPHQILNLAKPLAPKFNPRAGEPSVVPVWSSAEKPIIPPFKPPNLAGKEEGKTEMNENDRLDIPDYTAVRGKKAKPIKEIVPKKTRKPRKGFVAKTAEELEIDQLNAEAATWSDERLGEELKKVLDQLDGGSKLNEVGQASIAKNEIGLRDEPVMEKSVKLPIEPNETQKALIFVIGELTKLLGAA